MQPVTLEVRENVAFITIDNPPVNALSQAVRAGIEEGINSAESDPDVRAIVIHCRGKTFIAGADIREFGSAPERPYLPDLVAHIEDCDKPVVAAIHGTGLGGGLEVAMGCHYRIAVPSAQVGLPEVKLGLLPGATGTQRLPRLVGVETALEMMLSGDPVDAEKARQSGLLDQVVDEDNLLDAAARYALAATDSKPRRVRGLDVPTTDPEIFASTRAAIRAGTRGLFAPEQIIRCVEAATSASFAEGCEKERELFLKCKASPQSDGLIHSFFAHRAVRKVPGIDKQTTTRPIQHVAVIGAGTMGAGIAYACLTAGLQVFLLDNNDEGLQRGVATIRNLFEGGVARQKLSKQEMEAGLARLDSGTDYDSLADVDLVIEAVFENMDIKKEVFGKLDAACRKGAVLATNTSTLDVDEIAAVTKRPEDVIGLHFFSPAHIMRLLEIVRGARTSREVLATTLEFAKRLRKTSVVVGNCYGFVGNRMLYGYGRETQFLLLDGAAPETIDKVLYDWGMAMGPNAVGDLAGLDVGYKAREGRPDLPNDPRFYRIANLLVEQGRYGQKTGKGMYLYDAGSRQPRPDPEVAALISAEAKNLSVRQRQVAEDEIIERCIYALIAEGCRILEDGIATRSSDIDVIWINGYGFPAFRGGPMHFADATGLSNVLDKIDEFAERFGESFWARPALLAQLVQDGRNFADYDREQGQ